MGIVTRAEVTLSLCCLLVAACGGGGTPIDTDPVEMFNATTNTNPNKPATMAAAGSKAPFGGVMRATAKIQPLMLAPATTPPTTAGAAGMAAPSTGAAGATAATAGAGAAGMAASSSSAGAGAAGKSASAGAGGSAGARSFASNNVYAAGSGGDAAGTAAPATAAAGMGAAGMVAPPAMTTPPATTGAGMEAPAMISGSATFSSSSSGVNLTVMVSGCNSGKEYPIHIHTGTSCESAMTQMGHWDMTRGEGIPNIKCGGKQGATMFMRPSADPNSWSVGDGSATDVVGHTVVIHDADDPTQRIACGVIMKN